MLKEKRIYMYLLFAFFISHISYHPPTLNNKNDLSLQQIQQYALSQLRKSLDEVPLGKFPIRTKGLG